MTEYALDDMPCLYDELNGRLDAVNGLVHVLILASGSDATACELSAALYLLSDNIKNLCEELDRLNKKLYYLTEAEK